MNEGGDYVQPPLGFKFSTQSVVPNLNPLNASDKKVPPLYPQSLGEEIHFLFTPEVVEGSV